MGSIAESASAHVLDSLDTPATSSLGRQWAHCPGLREASSETKLGHMAKDTPRHLQFVAAPLVAGNRRAEGA